MKLLARLVGLVAMALAMCLPATVQAQSGYGEDRAQRSSRSSSSSTSGAVWRYYLRRAAARAAANNDDDERRYVAPREPEEDERNASTDRADNGDDNDDRDNDNDNDNGDNDNDNGDNDNADNDDYNDPDNDDDNDKADDDARDAQPNAAPAVDKEGFGATLQGVASNELADFAEGLEEFTSPDTPAEGLGPVFNDISCVACHSVPVSGGGSERLETRFGTTKNGLFDPLEEFGGSLLQDRGIGLVNSCAPPVNFQSEVVPRQATIIAQRRTTPLFGLGLVDAVPDATLRALRDQEARTSPATAGVLSEVIEVATGDKVVGKFGWKAHIPTLFQAAADAYFNEMGVTSDQFPEENCPQGDCARVQQCNPADSNPNDDGDDVIAFANFMTFLGPPPRGDITAAAQAGEREFETIGCTDCHTPSLTTGLNPIKALDRVTFHPYSDFLLHDMGPLGDGIEQGDATGRLMRTAPLWGVRKITRLLHDGRAASLEEAIKLHDGQAIDSREQFLALAAARRADLLAFLNSL